jgi:hypothetical protein
VPLLAQHLGSYVIWSPTQSLLPFSIIFHFGCQSKIPWDRGRKRGYSDGSLCHLSLPTAGSGLATQHRGSQILQAPVPTFSKSCPEISLYTVLAKGQPPTDPSHPPLKKEAVLLKGSYRDSRTQRSSGIKSGGGIHSKYVICKYANVMVKPSIL